MTSCTPPPPADDSGAIGDLTAEYPGWYGWRSVTGLCCAAKTGTGLAVHGWDWSAVRSEVARIESGNRPL